MKKLLLQLLGINKEFDQLFFLNESRSLSGEKNRVILALVVILIFTLLALGFAAGSIAKLQKKMDNPFTNWVDLGVTSVFISDQAHDIEQRYTDPAVGEQLKLMDVRGWVKFNLEFYHQDFNPTLHPYDSLTFGAWGRSIDEDDPILAKIFEEGGARILTDTYDDYSELVSGCNIILTEELATRLGYTPDSYPIESIYLRNGQNILALNVTAIVSELPKFCEFACSPQLYNILVAKKDLRGVGCDRFIEAPGNTSIYSYVVPTNADGDYKKRALTFFNTQSAPNVRKVETIVNGTQMLDVLELSFVPSDSVLLEDALNFASTLRNEKLPIGLLSSLECGADGCFELLPEDYYYLAFNFNRLDHIRAFQLDLKEQFDVDIDMSQVEAKENFALVSALTLIISSILLAFGVLSIILFVNNLLKSHLYKVRPHLGTLTAFGLNNRFLTRLYQRIIFAFLLVASLVAFLVGAVVDAVEGALQGAESQFNIFSYWIVLAIAILFVVSLIVASRTIRAILGDTPGNMIYGR